ncbi:MAG: hypothetical protein IKB00_06010 [Bacteroidaceae bacterium]|nr:hypothetical protein [Prevotella sp.]MBR2396144.1 hypothetical protein [Bacteroidaceae bacterium]
MIAERTINICGKDVKMRYCAATETGYETISGKPATIFMPDITKDAKGNIISIETKAETEDYIKLALAAIIAAYARDNQKAPIQSEEIMYDAQPKDVILLIKTVTELRNEWYDIPSIIKPDENQTEENQDEDKDNPKN